MHWPKSHIFQTSLWLNAQAHEIDLPYPQKQKHVPCAKLTRFCIIMED